MSRTLLLLFPILFSCTALVAQDDALVAAEDHYELGDAGIDPAPDLVAYDRLIKALGADSVRDCNGFPCSGWVEDTYPDGTIKHRGYYDAGQLITFKNHHPGGAMEREFKVQGTSKSILRTYHRNGSLRSETRFVGADVVVYRDHYVNGVLRYEEEHHMKRPYYKLMNLYDREGRPISTLQLVDGRNEEFEQKEFHPGGALKCEGRARYNPKRMDTQRVGTWKWYDADGTLLREERYIDGIAHR